MSQTALALIEKDDAIVYFNQPNGLDPVIAKIKEEVTGTVIDISTKKGREDCASLAYSIGKMKNAVDKRGKELVAAAKAQIKVVDAERSRAWDEIEKIQHSIRQPLTDWENADKERIAAHEGAIASIAGAHHFAGEPSSTEIQEAIDGLKRFHNRDWQEFEQRAKDAMDNAQGVLQTKLETTIQRENERAELERLRKEEADRKQREHEDRLKAEAAEKARRAAEAEAKRIADAEAARVKAEQERAAKEKADLEAMAKAEALRAEQEKQRIEAEKEAERKRADDAEKARISAEEKAKVDAEAARIKAENDAKEAAAKAEREKQAAIQAERDRIAAQEKRKADEAAAREADKAHRAKINNEALSDIQKHGRHAGDISEAAAKAIIAAIAKGEIRHVKISY